MVTNTQAVLVVAFIVMMPSLDVVTDIAYLFSTPFANVVYPVFVLFFLLLPIFHFAFVLHQKGAMCKWYIWQPPQSLLDNLSTPLDFSKLLNLLVTAFIKFMYVIAFLPWAVVNGFVLLPLFLLGALWHSTKILILRGCHNLWFQMWTGGNEFDLVTPVDLLAYNDSFYFGVLLESLPQFIIQIMNQVDVGMDINDAVPVMSITMSGFCIVSALYNIAYLHLFKRIPIKDLPIDVPLLGVLTVNDDDKMTLTKGGTYERVDQGRLLGGEDDLELRQQLFALSERVQTLEQLHSLSSERVISLEQEFSRMKSFEQQP